MRRGTLFLSLYESKQLVVDEYMMKVEVRWVLSLLESTLGG